MISGDWVWQVRYTPFSSAIMNSDTYLIVSPEKNILCTAEAEVISQITTRRNDFPKPIAMYKMLDLYGKNVVTVEGGEWRRHRKITAAQFNEKSNALVWKESLFQAGEMIKRWTDNKGTENGKSAKDVGRISVVSELGKDAMRLSLHVISRAGFGVRCLWPGATESEKDEMEAGSMSSTEIPKGCVTLHLMFEVVLIYVQPQDELHLKFRNTVTSDSSRPSLPRVAFE
jgi:hypothetical protein